MESKFDKATNGSGSMPKFFRNQKESIRALCRCLLRRLGLVTYLDSLGARIEVLRRPLGFIISSRRLY
jgi:hypothetical protein